MESKNEDHLIGKIFFKHYKLKEKIAKGHFTTIYKAINNDTKEECVVKLEKKDSVVSRNYLKKEAYILSKIKAFGIPKLKTCGYNTNYNILVMELLGDSLEKLFQLQSRSFTLKTICMLGIQMIDRIEYLHSRNLIHGNIKPDNFVIGRGSKSHIVYLLDFCLSKNYWSSTQRCHEPISKRKKFNGSLRYASINALKGYKQSRRDDLESLGYSIMYFNKGSLPWQGFKVSKKGELYKRILEKKKITSVKDLCYGFPKEFENFISYIRNLKYSQVPDYSYLRNLLKRVMKKNGDINDFYYDWCFEIPNISFDDKIYTNNYNIQYNGKKDYLKNFVPYQKSLKINECRYNDYDDDYNYNEYNKIENKVNNTQKYYNFNSINGRNSERDYCGFQYDGIKFTIYLEDNRKYLLSEDKK